ncbi:hypothetical protein [Ferruginibacter sp.]|nr:hypothetical protein [Ferruginibacter sp.]
MSHVDSLMDDNFTYNGYGQPAINKLQYIYFMKEILCKGFSQTDMQFLNVLCEWNIITVDYTNMMINSANISEYHLQVNE